MEYGRQLDESRIQRWDSKLRIRRLFYKPQDSCSADQDQHTQGRRVDFHGLRHTLATRLAVAGVQPRVAMELMRHSDMRLTQKVYTDASLLPTFDAVTSLPSLMNKEGDAGSQLRSQGSQLRSQKPDPSGAIKARPDSIGHAVEVAKHLDNKGLMHIETPPGTKGHKEGVGCRTRIRTNDEILFLYPELPTKMLNISRK